MRKSIDEKAAINEVAALSEGEMQQRQLDNDVRLGIDQLKSGQFNEYTLEQLCTRFEQLKNRVRQRIADSKKKAN